MSTQNVSVSKPFLPPLAVSLATTTVAAITLILANKLTVSFGRHAGLSDACWQLTALRAALAGATLTTLISLRKDHLALLGVIYAVSLSLTHGSVASFLFPVAAGTVAMLVRVGLFGRESSIAPPDAGAASGRGSSLPRELVLTLLPTLLPTLAFTLLLAGPSLVTKVSKSGLAAGLVDWTPNLALRLAAAGVAAAALTLVWPRGGRR